MNSVSSSGNVSCRVVYLPINVTFRQFYYYVCFAIRSNNFIISFVSNTPFDKVCKLINTCYTAVTLLLKVGINMFSLVDGNWNSWGEWGDCSVTCGDGVKTRIRTCTNPPPTDGGKECVGDSSSETSACSTTNCPGTVLITVRSTRYRSW